MHAAVLGWRKDAVLFLYVEDKTHKELARVLTQFWSRGGGQSYSASGEESPIDIWTRQVLLWTHNASGEQTGVWEEKREQELFLKRLRDFEKGGKRQTER